MDIAAGQNSNTLPTGAARTCAGMSASTGPGLRYDSPIGTFRLDVGFRLNETDQTAFEKRIWAIHFGLGETF